MAGQKKVPTQVLVRARAVSKPAAAAPAARASVPRHARPTAPNGARRAKEKVVAALKRLHPMD